MAVAARRATFGLGSAREPRVGAGRFGIWGRRAGFYGLLLLMWAGVARLGWWPSYVVPSPGAVGQSLASGLQKGVILQAAGVSLGRIALGYGLSAVAGMLLGLLLGRVRLADELLGSLVLGLQSLPSVCWLPLSILWFGLTEKAILFVVVMGALFSITQGVATAVKNTPALYVKAARNLGAFLVLIGVFIFFRKTSTRQRGAFVGGFGTLLRSRVDAKGTAYEWAYSLPLGMGVSFVVGFLAALLGVGGGILLVPVMVTFLAFAAPIATATSTFTLLFTSLSATLTHAAHNDFQGIVTITLLAAAGMVVGAQLGARLSQRMTGRFIVRLLAVALVFVGARLVQSAALP